ncbi:helix-turn-helix domain-containing protein [Chitinophaga defluvii]|uniref:Helix-turn-helix transcriptional regulator n=1 Tax=Chitinophaga defluvii TaxID=3163343 RepID=A0ABV2T9Z2_9BACT
MKSKEQILSDFGKRLLKLREAKKITQMDLAVKVDSYPNYISKLENGKSEPGLVILKSLAAALGVTVSDLTG